MNITYSVDRLRINSKEQPEALRSVLPLDYLGRYATRASFGHASEKAAMAGYKSYLELSGPSSECLALLMENLGHFGSYGISRLEVAKDTRFSSILEAQKVLEALVSGLYMKFARKEPRLIETSKRNCEGVGVLGKVAGSTLYLGNIGFEFAAYVRFSKVEGRPCVHEEFRFDGRNLRKRGIREVDDICGASSDLLRDIFENLYRRYVYMVQFDRVKVGKFILGLGRSKRMLTDREMMRINLVNSQIKSFGENKFFHVMNKKTRIHCLQSENEI